MEPNQTDSKGNLEEPEKAHPQKLQEKDTNIHSHRAGSKPHGHGLTLHSSISYKQLHKPLRNPVLPTHEALTKRNPISTIQPIRSQSVPRGVSNIHEKVAKVLNFREYVKKNFESPYKEVFSTPYKIPYTLLNKSRNRTELKTPSYEEEFQSLDRSRSTHNVGALSSRQNVTVLEKGDAKDPVLDVSHTGNKSAIHMKSKVKKQPTRQDSKREALPAILKPDKSLLVKKTASVKALSSRSALESHLHNNDDSKVGGEKTSSHDDQSKRFLVENQRIRFLEKVEVLGASEDAALPRVNSLQMRQLQELKQSQQPGTPRSGEKNYQQHRNLSLDARTPRHDTSQDFDRISQHSDNLNRSFEKEEIEKAAESKKSKFSKKKRHKRAPIQTNEKYFNPLFKDGYHLSETLLPDLQRSRPKISRKYKNSVKIQYPNVYMEEDRFRDLDVSIGDTSVDSDTYKYYTNLHNEVTHRERVKRLVKFDELMKMDIDKDFEPIAVDVYKLKVILST